MALTEDELIAFRTEASELLDQAETGLLDIDRGDALVRHYDPIFRAFHSIKGAAGMMEMTELQAHLHKLETLFAEQKLKPDLPKALIDLFLRGVDATRRLLRGEVVHFDYEIKTAVAAAPAPVRPAPVAASLGKVVVVDDEPDLVDLLTSVLESRELQVFGTSDPKKVMEIVRRERPDVVFTDIAMPGMSGLEVLAAVHAEFPDVPVILVSGAVDKDALLEAIRSGVYAVIEKPFETSKVIQYAFNAIERSHLTRGFLKSINLLLFQFADLSQFLLSAGREDLQKMIASDLSDLLEMKRGLKAFRKPEKAA